MKIEIYSDIACPWCYIGEKRFQRALAALPAADQVEVVYRPFQLDPTAPQSPVSMSEYLQRKFGARVEGLQQHVADAGRSEGIHFDFANGVVVNTLTAHRLLRLAEREYGAEVQRALAEKLFEAHFAHGADVADPESLTSLAASVGMDAERTRTYLASDEGVEETREEIQHGVALGVSAVPTFVFEGKYAVQGAQPTSTFLQVLEQVAAETAEPAESAGDACLDGSCAI